MIFDILAFISSFILTTIIKIDYLGIILLMTLESMGIPLPSEITMPFSGFLVSKGVFNFWKVVFAGTIGNIIGSIIFYGIGLYGGRIFVVKYGRYFLIREEEIEQAERWFKKYGSWSVFFGRFLPVIRTYISFPAGVLRMNFLKFNIFTFIGSLPWALLFTYLGFKLGEKWNLVEIYFKKFDLIIIIIIIGGFLWFIKKYYFAMRQKYSL